VLSTAAAAAALLATVFGAAGCGNSARQPVDMTPPDNTEYIQVLQRENADLRRRVEALERATPVSVPAAGSPVSTKAVTTDAATLESLRAENTQLRERLEAAAEKQSPPPVVLPTPAKSTSSGTNHTSHASHSSHASHRSHRSSR
jgi:hypothetical protein